MHLILASHCTALKTNHYIAIFTLIALIAFLNTLWAELITAVVTFMFVAIITIMANTIETGMHFCTIYAVVSFTRVAAI
eukprot:scaffold8557_cov100-Skeletonema_dohrnii-CCMP3373.AAC.11